MGSAFDNTLGAVLVGFAVACVVYGVLLTQAFSYFSRYPSDRPVYKFLVVLILLLETADQAFIGHAVYYYNVTCFADPLALLRGSVTWSFILQETVGAIVGWIVKTSFAMRVYRFSGQNVFITGFILMLTFGQLGVAMAFTVKAFTLPDLFAVSHITMLGTISLSIGVLTDIVVAVSLCYFLNRLRTGYKQSDSLVYSLVRYAINTGVLTSAVSISTLVLFNILQGRNFIYVATYFILSKLYAISFLATLNTRRVVRGRGTDQQTGNTAGSSRHIPRDRDTNLFHLGTRVPSLHAEDEESHFSPQQTDSFAKSFSSPRLQNFYTQEHQVLVM